MQAQPHSEVPNPGRRKLLKRGLYGGAGLVASTMLPSMGCFLRRPAAKPNVLLIVMDTARADRFSFMGYDRRTSPSIDALIPESTVYRNAFSTDFWTLPSHASLFTGLYPSQAGATSETNQLPSSAQTLAAVLKGVGYDTAAFVCNAWISTWRGFGNGFTAFRDAWRVDEADPTAKDQQPEERATRGAIRWLERHQDSENPFFLFMNLNRAHLPYEPAEPHLQTSVGERHNSDHLREMMQVKGMWEFLGGGIDLDEGDFAALSDLYDGEIANVDAYVGQVLDYLQSKGLLDNTLVIITSDHGENIGDHGMIDHLLSMYDTTLHIPLVIRYPGRFDGGSADPGELVSLIDIAPTILQVCDIPNALPGVATDLLSLCSEQRKPREYVIAENDRPINGIKIMQSQFPEFDIGKIDHRMRAIRTDKHKLIWREGVGSELYDVLEDPGETTDIASDHGGTRDRLTEDLQAWMRETPTVAAPSNNVSGDRQSQEVLRSLGYVK